MVPDYQHVIQYVRDSQAWDFTTKEGLCAYHNACVYALYTNDPNFGHLIKNEGQNHCTDPAGNLCATDVALYRPTGQIIDFISSAGYGVPPPSNDVTWQVGPEYEYPTSSWFAPVPNADGGGGTTPTPPPADLAAIQAQLNRIEQACLDQKLFLSNINDQINLMAGVVNELYAKQNPVYGGTLPRQGNELTLTPKV